jgi:hypothetical protein
MGLEDGFYVVSVITNPERFKQRPKLFKEFMARMDKYGAKLYVVEAIFGDRDFEVTDSSNVRHIQLRTTSEIWQKENLINIGISRLPKDWKYVAWIDGDIDFTSPTWIQDTVHELQHHAVVQMFQSASTLGPKHELLAISNSFMYNYKMQKTLPGTFKDLVPKEMPPETLFVRHNHVDHIDNEMKRDQNNQNTTVPSYGDGEDYDFKLKKERWHSGYAWAATREAINTMGGLLDFAILGSADWIMAWALLGRVEGCFRKGSYSENFVNLIKEWQERALRLHKNVGYVPGSVVHYWHGAIVKRGYCTRSKTLMDEKYDPHKHLHRDWQGVIALHNVHAGLRDKIRSYFQSRDEDSIEMC